MNYVNKLLRVYKFSSKLHHDTWTINHSIYSGMKKWVSGIVPNELLSRSIKQAINSIDSLCECTTFYQTFPNEINSPNYGDNWGIRANYIEINNRAISVIQKGTSSKGIISSIKILPAIPPSAKSWANCVILSQIFPNIYGDGYVKPHHEENSIYGIRLNAGYSKNVIDYDVLDYISQEEQFAVFNDLAHFRGLKTGFRTVISADQIKVNTTEFGDVTFDWNNSDHQELFINEHVKLINLGFEAIFIDSAKHIGGYDMVNYTGVGALPSYEQMQYILNEIRVRSGKTTLSFVGEKSTGDFARYKNLGLTTGTAFIEPDNFDVVRYWSEKLKYEQNYTPGVEVSNDNDEGGRSYEARLNRIHNVLFAYEYPSDKLPSFMQMEDLFPLRNDTNTHYLMMCNPSYSEDGSPESHWQNLFAQADGKEYNRKVGELFAHAMNL